MKLNQVYGVLAKEESVYGTAVSLSNTTDGCNPYVDSLPDAPTELEFEFDGNIGQSAGTLAPQKSTTPAGMFRQWPFKALFKGIGSAYTSSAVIPPYEVHRFLKAAGFDATFVTNKWEYTPTAAGTGYTSLTVEEYAQGEKWAMAGSVFDWSYEAGNLGVPMHTFSGKALPSLPSDSALPAVTVLNPSGIPPVAQALVHNIGLFAAAKIKSHSFKLQRQLFARVRQDASGGHLGFVPGRMEPIIEIEIEKEALVGGAFHTSAGLDADAIRRAATSVSFSMLYAGSTGNNWRIDFAQCQVKKVQHAADNTIATFKLTLKAHTSTPSANDAMKVTLY